jgi:hypothetical protein
MPKLLITRTAGGRLEPVFDYAQYPNLTAGTDSNTQAEMYNSSACCYAQP